MSKYVYKRIFVKDEHNMEVVIPYRCLSKEVKKLFRLKDVNLIEHGYCANLETYKGYHWDKETDRYTQITGSNWKMIPKDMFIKIKEDKMEDKKIELDWRSDKYEDAKKLRDSKARELRQEGYKVICKTWNFMDLGRFMLYSLEATKEG